MHARFGSRAAVVELADGVVEEPHLLVGDAEVVVALRVVDADLLGDALLELREDLLDVDLLVRRDRRPGGPTPLLRSPPSSAPSDSAMSKERSSTDAPAADGDGRVPEPPGVPRSCASSSASRSTQQRVVGQARELLFEDRPRVVVEAARREELGLLERRLELRGAGAARLLRSRLEVVGLRGVRVGRVDALRDQLERGLALRRAGSSGKLGSGRLAERIVHVVERAGASARGPTAGAVRMLGSEYERSATSSGPISSRSYEGRGASGS